MEEAASHSQMPVAFPLFGKTAQEIIALDDGGDFTPDAACDALDIDRATFDDRKGSCWHQASEPGLYELIWEYREALFDLIEFGTMNPHRQS